MSIDIYECKNAECKLLNIQEEYEFISGDKILGKRPVCRECLHNPALVPVKSYLGLKTAGCSLVSNPYIH